MGSQPSPRPTALPGADVLTGATWEQFVSSHWHRRPVLWKAATRAPFLTPRVVFDALLTAADRLPAPGLRLFSEGVPADGDRSFYPLASDESFEGYARRLAADKHMPRFCLILFSAQARSLPVWDAILEHFQGLFGLVGIPMERLAANLFIGNYAKTHTGAHTDPLDNFLFTILGKKRMRIWAPEVLPRADRPFVPMEYEPYLDECVTLEAEPGDIAYWPANHWHVGECEGLSISLNVDYWVPDPAFPPRWSGMEPIRAVLDRALGEELAALPRDEAFPMPRQSRVHELPLNLSGMLRSVQELCNSARFEELLLAEWLAHVSGYGFDEGPPLVERPHIAEGDRIAVDPIQRIFWSACGETIVWAANRRSAALSNVAPVRYLLERLDTGEPLGVSSLLDDFAEAASEFEVSRADVLQLLEDFARTGALRKVG